MLRELEHLLLIVEHGTFTTAASHAHLSQPALTASIQRLERQVGARLLNRGRHGAELTASGRAFLPRARAALSAFEEGIRVVAEVEGLGAGQVRIGAGATACTYLLPKTIARFRKRYPKVRFVLREMFRDAIEEQLRAGDIDLGIVTGGGDELWRKDELIVVASPKLDCEGAGFVTFPAGSATRKLMRQHFGEIDVVMELSGIAAVKTNVRAGIGVALLSRSAVEGDLASGKLVRVHWPKTPIRRSLYLIHAGLERLAPAATAIREMLLEDKPRRTPKRR